MEVEVKKIYLGKYVSVRDYVVKKAKDKGEDLIIKSGNDKMIVKNSELGKGLQDTHRQHSKFNEQEYYLVDFVWKPIKQKVVDPNQENLF